MERGINGSGGTGVKGISASSGFIRRLMWENQHKNGDEKIYEPPMRLAPDSEMNHPAIFNYKKMNEPSSFITKHFGHARAVALPRRVKKPQKNVEEPQKNVEEPQRNVEESQRNVEESEEDLLNRKRAEVIDKIKRINAIPDEKEKGEAIDEWYRSHPNMKAFMESRARERAREAEAKEAEAKEAEAKEAEGNTKMKLKIRAVESDAKKAKARAKATAEATAKAKLEAKAKAKAEEAKAKAKAKATAKAKAKAEAKATKATAKAKAKVSGAEAKLEERAEAKARAKAEEERARAEAKAKAEEKEEKVEVPNDIFSLEKTNKYIQKLLIDQRINIYTLTIKGLEARDKMYKSIRFHVMNGENVKQLPRNRDYSDLHAWAIENHPNELKKDNNWLHLLEYGEWKNGRWRNLTMRESRERAEKNEENRRIEHKREIDRMAEADRKKDERIASIYARKK